MMLHGVGVSQITNCDGDNEYDDWSDSLRMIEDD
jgi:hypothetical protein